MASGPLTSWQIDAGGGVETVTDFIFLNSKTTVDGDCSHEIKRCLLLERKVMTNLDSMLKSRHQSTYKGPYSESYGFSSRASLVAQAVKHLPAIGDPSSIPGSGRSPGKGNGNPLQHSCLGNSMDGGDW